MWSISSRGVGVKALVAEPLKKERDQHDNQTNRKICDNQTKLFIRIRRRLSDENPTFFKLCQDIYYVFHVQSHIFELQAKKKKGYTWDYLTN